MERANIFEEKDTKQPPSHEEQRDSCHADDGTEDFEGGDALVEEVPRGKEDEDGGHGHDGLGDACGGVERGHEGEGDTEEGTEQRGDEDEEHAAAVAHGTSDGAGLATEQHDEREADESRDRAHKGAGEGHDVEGFGRLDKGLVVGHAHLAEHQSDALPQSCTDAEEDASEGELESQRVVFPTLGKYAQPDAEHGDEHAENGEGRHALAEEEEAEKGGCGWGKGHKELAEAAANEEVGIEEAVVAQHIAHKARKGEPQPRLGIGIDGQRLSAHHPHQGGEQEQGQQHAQHVQSQRRDASAGHLGGKGSRRPREGYHEGYEFTFVQLTIKS